MKEWLPYIITMLVAILGSGVVVTVLQRRYAKADKKDDRAADTAQDILSDGAKIREELWGKFGEQQGLINTLQAQQLAGISERYELRLSIKGLEVREEECRAQVETLRRQVQAQKL